MRAIVPLKSESGMSMLVVVLVMLASTAAAVGILEWERQKAQLQSKLTSLATAEQIRQKIVGAVLSPTAWQLTQAGNANAFLNAGAGAPPLLNIYLANPAVPFYSSATAAAGFDLHGSTCAAFNATEGNDACPFRYEVRLVSRNFQNANWIDTLKFTLLYRPAHQTQTINTTSDKFTFLMVRNLNAQSMETPCVLLSGVFNQADGTCSVTFQREKSCASGSSYRGPAGNDCAVAAMPTTNCPSPKFVRGFNGDGTPICGDPP